MKKWFGKKQLLVGTLVVALGMAVYLNYYFAQSPSGLLDTSGTRQEQPDKHLGEALNVNATPENDYFFEGYRQAFGIYRAFNAHSIVAHTNQYAFDPSAKEFMLSRSLVTMKKLSAMAKEAEANLLFENVGERMHGNLLYDQKLFIDLFSRLPENVGALIDIGHAMLNDWDIFSVIDALGSRIRGYHIHNNDGTKDAHLPLFTEGLKYDQAKMKKLLKFMEQKTPNSEWILEYAPGIHITPLAIKRDMDKIVTCIS
jgi:hypothetical protein